MSITIERRAAVPHSVEGGRLVARSSRAELPDPLGDDQPDDVPVLTTERRLQRLTIVACDVGSRFAREGFSHDPVAWMLSPRRIFGGARALEACQEKEGFMRATLLHGLSLGLDLSPKDLDELLEGGEDGVAAPELAASSCRGRVGELFTCVIEGSDAACGSRLQAFCAMVAEDEDEVRLRLCVRYGRRLGAEAVVRRGVEGIGPVADALLSPTLRRMLVEVSINPAGPVGAGLDLQVEQRFAA